MVTPLTTHLGDETAADHRALTIDTTTRLYQWNMRPGASIGDITKHPGITCIDGHHRTSPPSLSADEAASAVLSLIGLPAGTATTSSITYTNWAHLPEWIEKVLDVSWSVTYGHIGVGEESANLLWCLKRDGLGAEIDSSESSERLKIRVHVESPANGDGILDMAASKRAVRRHLAKIIDSIDFIIELVWARGDLSEYGEYSVRYAAGDTGCAIVAAGPTVIEIYDSNRTLPLEMFDSYARKLLEYTVRRDSPPLTAPVIKRGPMLSLSDDDNSRLTRIKIRPVDIYFSLWFELDKPIAAAKATVEGSVRPFHVEHGKSRWALGWSSWILQLQGWDTTLRRCMRILQTWKPCFRRHRHLRLRLFTLSRHLERHVFLHHSNMPLIRFSFAKL